MSEGQVIESNPAETSAPVTGQAAPVESGTPESQNGQATTQVQSAPAEESFSTIDPKTLSPEMLAVYKNMQADYTKKTQHVADTRKKAEAYDQISKDQRFVDYWSGLNRQEKADFKEQKAEIEKKLGEKISDEEFTQSLQSKDGYLALHEKIAQHVMEKAQKQITVLEQQLSVKNAQDIVDNFATEQTPDGKPVRPDFYKMDEDQLITGYLRLNVPESGYSSEQYAQKLNEAYQWAKTTTQKYYEMGKSEALKIIQQKAASSSNPPTSAAKGAYTGPDPKKLSASEAFQLAKKGIRVPQES